MRTTTFIAVLVALVLLLTTLSMPPLVMSSPGNDSTPPPRIPAPILVSPANNATVPPGNITFAWIAMAGSTDCRFEIWGNVAYHDLTDWSAAASSTRSLAPGTYHWRAQSRGRSGESYWSTEWTVIVQAADGRPPTPVLLSPANDATVPPGNVTFTWDTATGATSYRVEIWNDTSYHYLSDWGTVTSKTHTLDPASYHWRVQSRNGFEESYWSAEWAVFVLPPDGRPPAPILISPANNATVPPGQVTFTWNSATGATLYRFEIWDDVCYHYLSDWDDFTSITRILPAGTYGWRAQSHNGFEESYWSAATVIVQPLSPGVALALWPAASTVGIGQVFEVRIVVNAGAQQVDGVHAYLSFDPAILAVVDAAGNPATTIVAGSAFDSMLVNSVNNATGKINYMAGQPSDPPLSGTFTLATIRFKALAIGASRVAFTDDGQIYSTVTYQGSNVLQSISNSSATVCEDQTRKAYLPVVLANR